MLHITHSVFYIKVVRHNCAIDVLAFKEVVAHSVWCTTRQKVLLLDKVIDSHTRTQHLPRTVPIGSSFL